MLTRRSFLLSSASAIAVTAAFTPPIFWLADETIEDYYLTDQSAWYLVEEKGASKGCTIFVDESATGANDGTSPKDAFTSLSDVDLPTDFWATIIIAPA